MFFFSAFFQQLNLLPIDFHKTKPFICNVYVTRSLVCFLVVFNFLFIYFLCKLDKFISMHRYSAFGKDVEIVTPEQKVVQGADSTNVM